MNYEGPRVTTGWVLKCGERYGLDRPADDDVIPVDDLVDATVFPTKRKARTSELGVDDRWRIVRLFRRVRGERGSGGPLT